jgi:hypothetical protein
MPRLGVRAARAFGTAALVAGLTTLASALACSLIVGDAIAIIHCDPDGGGAVCGTGQICAPSLTGPEHTCTKPCSSTSPCSMGMCDHDKGWCVPVNMSEASTPDSDEGLPDVGLPEAAMNDVAPMMEAEPDSGDGPPRCTGFGCPCMRIEDCDPKFVCVDKKAIPDLDAGAGGYCAKPCCTSLDCDMGDGGVNATVCYASGAGGNYCVPTGWLGDRSSIGGLGGGASCGSGPGSACRSGLCLDSGVCADTCCTTHSNVPECANPTSCLFAPFPGSGVDVHETANCGEPVGFAVMGGNCTVNTDCRSGLCVDSGLMFPPGFCQDPCRTAGECMSMFTLATCQYYQPDPMSADIVAACVPRMRGAGDGGVAVCFVDDYNSSTGDCLSGEHCRPEPNTMVGTMSYSVLACGM